MFLTVKQKILVVLLENGQLQNSEIAKRVGITEQWCSEMVNALHAGGLIESEFHAPRRVNRLSSVGRQIAERILEVERMSASLIQNR